MYNIYQLSLLKNSKNSVTELVELVKCGGPLIVDRNRIKRGVGTRQKQVQLKFLEKDLFFIFLFLMRLHTTKVYST